MWKYNNTADLPDVWIRNLVLCDACTRDRWHPEPSEFAPIESRFIRLSARFVRGGTGTCARGKERLKDAVLLLKKSFKRL